MGLFKRLQSLLPHLSEKPRITPSDDIYRADWHDFEWYIPNNDASQARWCRNFISSHERFFDMLSGTDTIIEVGAATGEYTVEAASRLDNGHIHAFEAEPLNFRSLEKNIDSHGYSNRVTSHNMAISDGSKDQLTFQVADSVAEHKVADADVSNSDDEYRSIVGDAADNKQSEIDVPATTIDDYCSTHDINSVDLLKLTVNGHEPTILQGAAETLERTTAVFLNVEYERATELLQAHGFEKTHNRKHQSLGSPQFWTHADLN
ncbi:hypothetical protein BV210_11665 [Halorientalis sp. IM1011]|uniref:FkbM family methyltransferase n=1 Tax=Halorientalis sp. IM1011 TaxID=1932360 RepID=UPI00097CD263|nr:FkbM family methyltransferase [Halorientalis sp. IM1011]AQL43308.1 hypothetical protein BV210_11665 [Halorientalis sp. IM1011]